MRAGFWLRIVIPAAALFAAACSVQHEGSPTAAPVDTAPQPLVPPASAEPLSVAPRPAWASIQEAAPAPPALPPPVPHAPSIEERPFVQEGSGGMVGAVRRQGSAGSGRRADGESITLNFDRTPIRDAAGSILGDLLGVNYMIDDGVLGTVTLQTSDPVPRSALLPMLEDMLANQGAALVREDDLYRVIPQAQASRAAPARIRAGRPGDGSQVTVVPLRYVSAGQLLDVLEPFAPLDGYIRADEARNVLLISGSPREAATVTSLISAFDIDLLRGMSFALQPLKHSDPTAVAGELDQIFAGEENPLRGMVRFIPISRLNAILAVAKQPSYLAAALDWVGRLDRRQEGGLTVHVYRLENSRSVDVADVLQRIFSPDDREHAARTPSAGDAPAIAAVSPGGRIVRPVPASTTDEPPVETEAGVAPAALKLPATTGAAPGTNTIRIIPDRRNNAIVVLATPSDYRIVEEAIRQLDVQPMQVLIEATIAEVTLNDRLRYGVQWFFRSGDSSFSLSESATGLVSPVFPGFSYFLSGDDVRVAISALESVTDLRVISSPQIMVLDNETATLQVGDQVPIVVQSAVSVSDPDAPIVNAVELRDTGVLLTVTPRVGADGLVMLDIAQEVSDAVQTVTSGIDSPTIQQRRISSSIAVDHNETVALGGLIRDRSRRGNSGVPLLKDIPVLGNLFKTTENDDGRTELLILITPRVVRDQMQARAVTEELRRRLRGLEPLGERIQ